MSLDSEYSVNSEDSSIISINNTSNYNPLNPTITSSNNTPSIIETPLNNPKVNKRKDPNIDPSYNSPRFILKSPSKEKAYIFTNNLFIRELLPINLTYN
jgi:hypothetical protein